MIFFVHKEIFCKFAPELKTNRLLKQITTVKTHKVKR